MPKHGKKYKYRVQVLLSEDEYARFFELVEEFGSTESGLARKFIVDGLTGYEETL